MPLTQINEHSFFSNRINNGTRVLDLGGNRGKFALEIVRTFGCQCVCVEPNETLSTALAGKPGIRVLNLAVSAQSGRTMFHISKNSEASSLLVVESEARRLVDTVVVDAITLPECLARTGWDDVDLVKMDIEGAEIDVLDSCSDEFLLKFPQFTIEFHDFCGITPTSEVERVAARLRRLGFGMVSLWREGHGDVVFVQRRRAGVGLVDFLIAKYWLRNWWGLRRILARTLRRSDGR
jgi:FkbM family methyltransferase